MVIDEFIESLEYDQAVCLWRWLDTSNDESGLSVLLMNYLKTKFLETSYR